MSDSFMWMDDRIKVTKDLLSILRHYNYPYVIFTRSDLVARDDYASLLNKDLAAVQFSISSLNDDLNAKIEPGAPSAQRRLMALARLSELGIWTTVRINPLFPIYPDGYFTDPNFNWDGPVPKFNFSAFEMVDEIAAAGVPSVLAGMGRFSSLSLNLMEKSVGMNLKQFFRTESENRKSKRDFHFSDAESRHYYKILKDRCNANGVQFSTCYIGNGEKHFWKDQDLWSNKKDCCNIKDRVSQFKTDCREITFQTRLNLSSKKSTQSSNLASLHIPLGDTSDHLPGKLVNLGKHKDQGELHT